MSKPDYREELSFCCSPLAVELLDELIARHRIRSRGQLLREMVEIYLAKARVNRADLKRIEADHDRLNMVRPRRAKHQPATDSTAETDATPSIA